MSVLKWYLHLHDIRAWWIFTKSQHPMFSGPLNTSPLYPFICLLPHTCVRPYDLLRFCGKPPNLTCGRLRPCLL